MTLKPIIILTFPRTGASSLTNKFAQAIKEENNYIPMPNELTDCPHEQMLPKLFETSKHIDDKKIFATKIHIHRFMHFRYTEMIKSVEWVNNLLEKCNFLILKRENVYELCLSYLKAQFTNKWGSDRDAILSNKIIVPKIAVEKFKHEFQFFNSLCNELNVNIPVLTYEDLYYRQKYSALNNIVEELPHDYKISNEKYAGDNLLDFENFEQIKDWLK